MPLAAQHLRHDVGVDDGLVEVDGGDHVAALGRVRHERRGVGRAPRPSRRSSSADRSQRDGRPVEAAVLVDPVDLLVGQEDRGQRRRVVGLVLAAVLEGDRRGRATPGTQRSDAAMRSMRSMAAGDTAASHRPAVAGAGTSAGRSSRRRPRSGRSAGRRRPRWRRPARGRRRPCGPLERHGHAGRRLVVGEAVGVDLGVGDRQRVGARVGEEDRRLARGAARRRPPRRTSTRTRRSAGAGCALDEAEGGGVPERRGAAVAEQHLVAVGQGEELGQPVAQGARPRTAPGPGGGRCRGSRAPPRPGPPPPRAAPWRGRSRTGRRRAGGRRGS